MRAELKVLAEEARLEGILTRSMTDVSECVTKHFSHGRPCWMSKVLSSHGKE
jgi:hypothetical protein